MELEWHDFEYDEPPTNRAIWVYLGSNNVELVYIKTSNMDPLVVNCVRVLDQSVNIDHTKILAWAEFLYPPIPKRTWST